MKTTTKLTLVRHGHTDWNGMGRYQGNAPIPLSTRGVAQAAALVSVLAGDTTIRAIYCSDLLRCRQTAAPSAAALGLPIQFDSRLRETDYGNWQGLTRAEAEAWDAEAFAVYRADPEGVAIPGGESQQALAVRVLEALDEVVAAVNGGHVLVVTHGGPLRVILRRYGLWGGGRPSGNVSRTVIELRGDQAVLQLDGDVSHLPPELRPEPAGTSFLV